MEAILFLSFIGFLMYLHFKGDEEPEVIDDREPIVVPARGLNPDIGKIIRFNVLNPNGSGLSRKIMSLLRDHELFSYPVQLTEPVTGYDPNGDPIEIKTLGQWIWGVPGYPGNVKFHPNEGETKISIPLNAPEEVFTLIRSAYPLSLILRGESESVHSPVIRTREEITDDYLQHGRKVYAAKVLR